MVYSIAMQDLQRHIAPLGLGLRRRVRTFAASTLGALLATALVPALPARADDTKSEAKPQALPAVLQPNLPPPGKIVKRPNVVAVTELRFDKPIARPGDELTATAKLQNLTERNLDNVAFTFRLPDGVERTGTIPKILAKGFASLDQKFPAQGIGEHVLAFTADPGKALGEPETERGDNAASAKLFVAAAGTPWADWSKKGAGRLLDMVGKLRTESCIDGSINASVLRIQKIEVGKIEAKDLGGALAGDGVPPDVANAIAETTSAVYRAWAQDFRGIWGNAFPMFAAWPSAKTPPMPSDPAILGTIGGSPESTKAISAGEIEAALRSRLAKRLQDAGANEGVKLLAASMAAQLDTWVATQIVKVTGRGPVPSFSPPIVALGPVVGGEIVRDGGCHHLP